MRFVVAIGVTFGASVVLTLVIRALATRLGVVAAPRQDRWHRRPTPMLGGLAVIGAFAGGWAAFGRVDPRVVALVAGGLILSTVGLLDDLQRWKPAVKLVIQIAVAAGVNSFGIHLQWSGRPLIDHVVTIFWLVGITNALNLLDNMDGLAGGITVISSFFLAITFRLNGQPDVVMLAALLGAAVAGFLVFNFHPATIFMGDCGSTFLGFLLGGLALFSDSGRSRNLAVILLAPVLILLIPIFDTCLVTATRKLSGRAASQGGRDHSSHRLVALGMSEVSAVLTLYALAAASGLLALIVRLSKTESLIVFVPVFAVGMVLLGVHLGKVRVWEAADVPQVHTVITALSEFAYKRRVFEILLDVVLISVAYYSAYWLRFETGFPAEQAAILVRTLPAVVLCQMLCLLAAGAYSGLWRYAGLNELLAIARAAIAGVVVSGAIVFAMYGFVGPSRAVFILYFLLVLVMIGGSRLSFRVFQLILPDEARLNEDCQPVVIYGAGDAGEILIRELHSNPAHKYWPVAFVDDDWRKVGRMLHGCRILSHTQLAGVIRKKGVKEVLVSTPKVPETKVDCMRDLGLLPRRVSIRIE